VQRAAEAVYTDAGRAQVKALIDDYMRNAALVRKSMQELGYALVLYEFYTKDGRRVESIMPSKFRPVNGLMLPREIVRKHYVPGDGGLTVVQQVNVQVDAYEVGSPDNTEKRYRMEWPPGTIVRDTRSNSSFRVGEDGELRPLSEPGRRGPATEPAAPPGNGSN
jgi:hypothetical protein